MVTIKISHLNTIDLSQLNTSQQKQIVGSRANTPYVSNTEEAFEIQLEGYSEGFYNISSDGNSIAFTPNAPIYGVASTLPRSFEVKDIT
jgi:hypothetical protein